MRASPKAMLRPRRRSRPSARISPSLAAARKLTLRSRVVCPTPPAAFSLVVLRAPPTAMSTSALRTPPCTGAPTRIAQRIAHGHPQLHPPVARFVHLHIEIAPEEIGLRPLAGEGEEVGGHGGSFIPKSRTGLKRPPPAHPRFGRLGPCPRRTRTHHPWRGETWQRELASSERGPSARLLAAC